MIKENVDKRLLVLLTIVLLAALCRVLTQGWIPNVTPIGAVALFGGAYFMDKKVAFIVPMLAMFLSDLFLGLHNTMLFVYAGFAFTVMLGFALRKHNTVAKTVGITFLSAILFFLLTNFGTWLMYDFYPKNFHGLMESFAAGIPFFRNSLMGDLGYVAVFFGAFELSKRWMPALNVSLK